MPPSCPVSSTWVSGVKNDAPAVPRTTYCQSKIAGPCVLAVVCINASAVCPAVTAPKACAAVADPIDAGTAEAREWRDLARSQPDDDPLLARAGSGRRGGPRLQHRTRKNLPVSRGDVPSGSILPRLIRLRDAPPYLGMDRNRFNGVVRPHLTEIPIGRQGIAFDRLELDAWVDQYKSRNGRPGQPKGAKP